MPSEVGQGGQAVRHGPGSEDHGRILPRGSDTTCVVLLPGRTSGERGSVSRAREPCCRGGRSPHDGNGCEQPIPPGERLQHRASSPPPWSASSPAPEAHVVVRQSSLPGLLAGAGAGAGVPPGRAAQCPGACAALVPHGAVARAGASAPRVGSGCAAHQEERRPRGVGREGTPALTGAVPGRSVLQPCRNNSIPYRTRSTNSAS